MKSILFVVYLNFVLSLSMNTQGWGYINLHCRDNDNSPVNWWYIYKPPSDVVPFFELGRNFTFITPDSLGRWESSDKSITSNSMLQHTLAPIFRPTYADHLAVAIYDERVSDKGFPGSLARGVLMADELGGVWIYHTVPGLVSMNEDRPRFPEKESSKGHILMCLSLDLKAVNTVIHNLRSVRPQVTYLRIPEQIEHLLPEWNLLEMPVKAIEALVWFGGRLQPRLVTTLASKVPSNDAQDYTFSYHRVRTNPKPLRFVTRGGFLRVEVFTKFPGDKRSIYQRFASAKNIVLDVYGQSESEKITSICSKKYSVRNVENISLKLPESVMYVRNKTNRMWFAVSTAAHWQSLGTGPKKYWACISNLDKEDKKGAGGDLVCVENYRVWHTFDSLKVSEPSCMQ